MDTHSEPHFRALVIEAVQIVGSQGQLAEKLHRSQQQISALCTKATFISAEDALGIHYATGGKIPASSIRPDLWASPDHVPEESPPQAPNDGHDDQQPHADQGAAADTVEVTG